MEKFGCTVTSDENNWLKITGNLSQIKDVSTFLKNSDEKTKSSVCKNVIYKAMSERDYKVLMHFADTRNWFNQYGKSIYFDGHALTCVVPIDEYKKIEEDIEKHLQEIKQMISVTCYDHITDESKEFIQGFAKKYMYSNVFLFVNDNSIEIISDSYEDALQLQDMLKPKAPVKSVRQGRIFAKPGK